MKPVEGRRSPLSRLVLTVVGGCLCMILVVQPACSGSGDDRGETDAPLGLDAPKGPDGATVDAPPSGEADAAGFSQCWATAAAPYTNATQACGIGDTTLSVIGSEIQLSPFGTNGAVLFEPSTLGSGIVAWATGLTIMGAANSTCSVTCIPARGATPATVAISCSYSTSSQCTQNPQRVN